MYEALKFGMTSLFPYVHVIRLLSQITGKNLDITSNHCEFIIYLLFILVIIIIITAITIININICLFIYL